MSMTPELQKLIAELRERHDVDVKSFGCFRWNTARKCPLSQQAADMLEAQAAEIEDLKISVVAFGAPAVVEYAKRAGLPDGHLHPRHYDILKNAGARMDCFVRATLTTGEPIND